jgi:hypothetical protein
MRNTVLIGLKNESKNRQRAIIKAEIEDAPNLFEREVLEEVSKSNIYAYSSKPWEYVNLDKYMKWQQVFKRYLFAGVKILISYSELICYIWMVIATIIKAGLLYLVYPILIFGYCMLEEQRPGKFFWFFIIAYTQILIASNFLLQLDLWTVLLSEKHAE